MTDRISLERIGAVARITLMRPAQLNPIDHQTLEELIAAVDLVETEEVRAVVLTGTGRAFSAGGDIKEMETDTEESFAETTELYQRLAHRVTASPVVFIAAVNGYALGGGLELALICDLRIAASSARLGLPDLHLGYSPTSGLTYLLTRTVGFGRAMHLAFDTSPISADEALQIGLIGAITADDELEETAQTLAEQIAGFPATGVRLTKAGFYRAAETSLADTLAVEMAADIECFVSPETQQAIAEFVASRAR